MPRRDGGGPAPGGVDAEADLAGASGDACGGVQDPVAEGGDLTTAQFGVVGEADEVEEVVGYQSLPVPLDGAESPSCKFYDAASRAIPGTT